MWHFHTPKEGMGTQEHKYSVLPCAFNNVAGLSDGEALHAPRPEDPDLFHVVVLQNMGDSEGREIAPYRGLPILERAIILQ